MQKLVIDVQMERKKPRKKKAEKPSDLSHLFGFNIVVNNDLPKDTIFITDMSKMFDDKLSDEEKAKYCIKIINVKT